MECIIIYFSQTGNTEKVAKAIQVGVKQAAGHCDIVKIKDANPRRLYEYDLIGLGSLVFFGEPGNVTAFINNMRNVEGKHTFVFCTHGCLPVAFFPSIYPRLTNRGLIVIGMRDWYGSVHISHAPKPYATDGHPDETDLKEAEDFGKKMVENSRKISAGEIELIPPKPPAFKDVLQELPKKPTPGAPPLYPLPEFGHVLKTKMQYHKEKCTYPECRLCMDNCPMGGIDLSVAPPVIAKPCMDCEWCIKICPTGAIEADDFMQWSTWIFYEHLRFYHLPFLAKEEAAGRFRRHVPIEDIGWGSPVFRILRNKHPYWVIGEGTTSYNKPLDLPDR